MFSFEFLEKVPDLIAPNLKAKNPSLYFLWREVCHVTGSIILIFLSYILLIKTNYNIIPPLFLFLFVWMTYQEFYLHPKKYNQKLYKSIADWLAWITPFVLYLIFFY